MEALFIIFTLLVATFNHPAQVSEKPIKKAVRVSPTATPSPTPTITPTPVKEYIYIQPTSTPVPTVSDEEYETMRDAMIYDSQSKTIDEYNEWRLQQKVEEMYNSYKYGL